eukprot:754814-Hanusia_phi.AAC.1
MKGGGSNKGGPIFDPHPTSVLRAGRRGLARLNLPGYHVEPGGAGAADRAGPGIWPELPGPETDGESRGSDP